MPSKPVAISVRWGAVRFYNLSTGLLAPLPTFGGSVLKTKVLAGGA